MAELLKSALAVDLFVPPLGGADLGFERLQHLGLDIIGALFGNVLRDARSDRDLLLAH